MWLIHKKGPGSICSIYWWEHTFCQILAIRHKRDRSHYYMTRGGKLYSLFPAIHTWGVECNILCSFCCTESTCSFASVGFLFILHPYPGSRPPPNMSSSKKKQFSQSLCFFLWNRQFLAQSFNSPNNVELMSLNLWNPNWNLTLKRCFLNFTPGTGWSSCLKWYSYVNFQLFSHCIMTSSLWNCYSHKMDCCCTSSLGNSLGVEWSWLSLCWIQLVLLQLPWVKLKMPWVFQYPRSAAIVFDRWLEHISPERSVHSYCMLLAFIQSALQYTECIRFQSSCSEGLYANSS